MTDIAALNGKSNIHNTINNMYITVSIVQYKCHKKINCKNNKDPVCCSIEHCKLMMYYLPH